MVRTAVSHCRVIADVATGVRHQWNGTRYAQVSSDIWLSVPLAGVALFLFEAPEYLLFHQTKSKQNGAFLC